MPATLVGPTISADSHVTEPPEALRRRIDPRFRERAPVLVHLDRWARRHAHRPGHADEPQSRTVDDRRRPAVPAEEIGYTNVGVGGAAPRRAGTRSRVSSSRTATASSRRCSIRRSGCCSATTPTSTTRRPASTRTTAGSPSVRVRARPARRRRSDRDAHARRGHRRPGVDPRPRAARRDAPRRRLRRTPTTTTPSRTRSGRRRSTSGCRSRSTSSRPAASTLGSDAYRGPKMNGFLGIIRGQPGPHRHADLRWGVRAASRAARRVRRGRRGLGAALDVPRGPRLPAPPQLAGHRLALAAAVASTSGTTCTSRSRTTSWRSGCARPMIGRIDQLLWASDHPHSDATWPHSQELLAEHTAHMTEHQRDRVLRESTAELYGIPSGLAPCGPGTRPGIAARRVLKHVPVAVRIPRPGRIVRPAGRCPSSSTRGEW